jgi:hypothetical protein
MRSWQRLSERQTGREEPDPPQSDAPLNLPKLRHDARFF